MAETEKANVTTIGRQELSKRIAKQAKLSQKQASEVLEATLDVIREAVAHFQRPQHCRFAHVFYVDTVSGRLAGLVAIHVEVLDRAPMPPLRIRSRSRSHRRRRNHVGI